MKHQRILNGIKVYTLASKFDCCKLYKCFRFAMFSSIDQAQKIYIFIFMANFLFIFIHSLLADILHLDDWKEDSRQGILVDLYFYTLQYPFVKYFLNLIVEI